MAKLMNDGYRMLSFGEYEKVLYLLLLHGYILKKGVIATVKSDTQARDIIRRAIANKHIAEFAISTRVDHRKRELCGYRITNAGIDYLKHVTPPAAQPEIQWVSLIQADGDVILRDSNRLSKDALIRFFQVSLTSAFMAGMGASIIEAYPDELNLIEQGKGSVPPISTRERQRAGDYYRTEYYEPGLYRTGHDYYNEKKVGEDRYCAGERTAESEMGREFNAETHYQNHADRKDRYISVIVSRAKEAYFGDSWQDAPVLNAASQIKFVNSHTVKRILSQNSMNPYEYRRDRMDGIVYSDRKAALVYSTLQGTFQWKPWSYRHELKSFFSYLTRYSDFKEKRTLHDPITVWRNGIVLVNSPKDLEKIYRPFLQDYRNGKGKSGNQIELGCNMDEFVVVPVNRNGQLNLAQYLEFDLENFYSAALQSGLKNGFMTGPIEHRTIFPIQHPGGRYVFVGPFLDIVRINSLLLYQESRNGDFDIVCYDWQIDYYQRLFPNARFMVIDFV